MPARGTLTGALSALCLLLSACAARRPTVERILEHRATIEIHPDATLSVRETTRVRSRGVRIRHGIIRRLPGRYVDSTGAEHRARYSVESVVRDGRPEPHDVIEGDRGSLTVYLGDRGVPLPPGEHTYVLRYRTGPHLVRLGDRWELPWELSAPGGALPIDAASATVQLPDSVPEGELRARGVVAGPDRRLRVEAEAKGSVVRIRSPKRLATDEGLRFFVSWPPDALPVRPADR
ncbi:MAG: DUF2207 domain-containing protein [Planctomycetota bacterium]